VKPTSLNVCYAFLLSGGILFAGQNHSQISSQQRRGQDEATSQSQDCGVQSTIALNLVVREFPPSRRYIFLFLERDSFTRESLRRIFLCLSAQYPQPEFLMIVARSDRGNLQTWIDHYLAVHSLRHDGVFERRNVRPKHPPDQDQPEVGFFRARYFRSDDLEEFSFSPDPGRVDMSSETIRRPGGFSFTRNAVEDLVRASNLGLLDEVERSLDSGADIKGRDKYGRTALIAAVLAGRDRVFQLLLERGADVDEMDADGWTPLICAVTYRRTAMAEVLVRRGADVNAAAVNGDTPLTISTSNGLTRIVSLLIDHGSDLTKRDKYGMTPLMIAEEKGERSIELLLKDAKRRN
jgi:Ankyrin repeats (3 copies)/Ankyrin repeat